MLAPETPLMSVWNWIRERAEKGDKCPACGQRFQVYWRTINAGMAVSAIKLYRLHCETPWRWVHLPTEVGRISAEESKLRWWGLVESSDNLREDGGKASQWRMTQKGVEWVCGRIAVPCYAKVFDGRLWDLTRHSKSGVFHEDITIRTALGEKFDYDKLMAGE